MGSQFEVRSCGGRDGSHIGVRKGGDEYWLLLSFLLFIQARTPAHGMALWMVRTSFPISVNLI